MIFYIHLPLYIISVGFLRIIKFILTVFAVLFLVLHVSAERKRIEGKLASKMNADYEEAVGYARQSNYVEAEKAYKHILATYDDDMMQIKTSLRIAEMYFMSGHPDSTMYYTRKAHDNIVIRDSVNLLFHVNNLFAWVYLTKNDFHHCDSILQKSLSHLDTITDPEAIAKFYYIAGKYAFASNDFVTGVKVLQNASREYSTDIITPEYGRVLLLIAQMYQIKNDFDLAQKNAEEALMIFERQNFGVSKIDAYCSLGSMYIQKNDLNKAFECYMSAKKVSDTLQTKRGSETADLGLACWYLEKNDIQSAIEHGYPITESEHENNTNPDVWFEATIRFGEYYINNDDIANAKIYAEKAWQMCEGTHSWLKLSVLTRLQGNISYKSKDYRKAANLFRISQLYADSLAYNLRLVDIDSLGMMPELKRQSDMIYMLASENDSKTTTIEDNTSIINRQRSSILSLAGLFVIGFILMFMLAWSFLQKSRDNKALTRINAKIAQQKEEIEVQRENLLNYTMELERMSLIVRETDNAIRVFDSNGHTIWVNSGYSRLYGYSLEDLQNDDSLGFSKVNPIDIKKIIKTWDTERQSIELESQISNKWNIKLWVQTTLSPIFDVNTMEISQLIAIDTNITSLKKAQQDILAMNEEITSSLTYAKRIQEAMLSPVSVLTKHYPNSFCYYKPRSIVSGDFYWMAEQSGRIVVVCADSTGHGVPGAFLSLIGISLLSKIVNERGIVQPAIVLNRLRMNVINYLHQTTAEPSAGDGMDMSIISIDKKNNIMEFAGAMTPMYIVRDNKVIELKPDRMPVGYYDNENRAFSSSKIALKHGDQLYMFTDGYYDQFGGSDGLKMKTNQFKSVLMQCHLKSNEEQVAILDKEWNAWRSHYDQIDDVLVMGIRIE